MRPSRRTAPFLVPFVLILTACGSTGPAETPDPLARFVGTWTGISTLLTPVGEGSPIDLILAGATLDIAVQSTGAFSMTLVFLPFMVDQVTSGTLSVSGNQITMTITGEATPFGSSFAGTFTFSQNDSRMALVLTSGVVFDFDQDGQDEPATMTLVVQKQ